MLQRPFKNFAIGFWYLRTVSTDKSSTLLFDMGAGFTLLNWQAAERLGVRKAQFRRIMARRPVLQDVLGKKAPAVGWRTSASRSPAKRRKQPAIIADARVQLFRP